jgi:hypothetical protein
MRVAVALFSRRHSRTKAPHMAQQDQQFDRTTAEDALRTIVRLLARSAAQDAPDKATSTSTIPETSRDEEDNPNGIPD